MSHDVTLYLKLYAPCNKFVYSHVTGAGRSGDEEGLVEHEEIPETDYPDAPDISVTMVIEDAGPALPSPPPEPPLNPSAG